MRNISFSLTTKQFSDRTKDVTRRLGWVNLKPGDQLMGCKKCMGLRIDEPLVRLGALEVVSVKREPLSAMLADPVYGMAECRREGFPYMTPEQFVLFFCESHKNCTVDTPLTRIEFKRL